MISAAGTTQRIEFVLDCRNEDALATGTEQGEVVGLGAAADKDYSLWICITE